MQANTFSIKSTWACKHPFTEQYQRSVHPSEKNHITILYTYTKNLKGWLLWIIDVSFNSELVTLYNRRLHAATRLFHFYFNIHIILTQIKI
jgi:hypothetical protein